MDTSLRYAVLSEHHSQETSAAEVYPTHIQPIGHVDRRDLQIRAPTTIHAATEDQPERCAGRLTLTGDKANEGLRTSGCHQDMGTGCLPPITQEEKVFANHVRGERVTSRALRMPTTSIPVIRHGSP